MPKAVSMHAHCIWFASSLMVILHSAATGMQASFADAFCRLSELVVRQSCRREEKH